MRYGSTMHCARTAWTPLLAFVIGCGAPSAEPPPRSTPAPNQVAEPSPKQTKAEARRAADPAAVAAANAAATAAASAFATADLEWWKAGDRACAHEYHGPGRLRGRAPPEGHAVWCEYGPDAYGRYLGWYPNGNPKMMGALEGEGEWGAGVEPDGAWLFWHEDGVPRATGQFGVDTGGAHAEGAWTFWWPAGSLRAQGEFMRFPGLGMAGFPSPPKGSWVFVGRSGDADTCTYDGGFAHFRSPAARPCDRRIIDIALMIQSTKPQRDEILQTLVGANMQIIRTICQGEVP